MAVVAVEERLGQMEAGRHQIGEVLMVVMKGNNDVGRDAIDNHAPGRSSMEYLLLYVSHPSFM